VNQRNGETTKPHNGEGYSSKVRGEGIRAGTKRQSFGVLCDGAICCLPFAMKLARASGAWQPGSHSRPLALHRICTPSLQ